MTDMENKSKNNLKSVARRQAREAAFKLIFAFLFTGETGEGAVAESELMAEAELKTLGVAESEYGYLETVYRGVVQEYDALYALIGSHSKAFATERIFKTDLAVLLLAAYELLHMSDIPSAVSANEAVELSQIYCSEKSPKFINGVLSAIIKEKETEKESTETDTCQQSI